MPDQTRNLNSVTDFTGTLDSNDRIIMTDNKASLKALTTAILGKAMIEGYTGSSLAGSSQSVKSAIDGLNSNKLPSIVSESTGGASYNLNDLRTQGLYYINPASQNVPTNTTWGWLVVIKRNSEIMYQQFIGTNGLEYRRHSLTATTWGDWYQLPSRQEIAALNSNINKFKVAKFDVSDINALQTKLTEIATNYSNYDFTMVSFSVSSASTYFMRGTGYEGLLYKNAEGYLVLEAFNHGGTALPVLGRCANGTWVWDNFALNSKLTLYNTANNVAFELPSSKSYIKIKLLNSGGTGAEVTIARDGSITFDAIE